MGLYFVVALLCICMTWEVAALRPNLSPRALFYARTPTRLCQFRDNAERDEQFRLQQEMLARRKNPKLRAEAERKVDERRQAMANEVGKNMWAKITPKDEDPLVQWKKAKDAGELKDLGYEETTKNRDLRFSIPLIASPIDQPAYDNGLRFDLRLPYAERGYEDESADVMGNLGKSFAKMFGKKEAAVPPPAPKEPPAPKKKGPFGW